MSGGVHPQMLPPSVSVPAAVKIPFQHLRACMI